MLLADDKATHPGWHFATIMYFQNDSFIRFRENIIACGRIKLYKVDKILVNLIIKMRIYNWKISLCKVIL